MPAASVSKKDYPLPVALQFILLNAKFLRRVFKVEGLSAAASENRSAGLKLRHLYLPAHEYLLRLPRKQLQRVVAGRASVVLPALLFAGRCTT